MAMIEIGLSACVEKVTGAPNLFRMPPPPSRGVEHSALPATGGKVRAGPRDDRRGVHETL